MSPWAVSHVDRLDNARDLLTLFDVLTMLPTPSIEISAALRARVGRRIVAELARRARRAARLLGVEAEALRCLGLRLVDDAEMAQLHLAYMDEPGPTDVMSFPVARPEIGGEALGDPQLAALGDIVIDWDAVERQAWGPSLAARLDEATVLLVHGLAHLLGHDHRDRHEGRRMHRVEQRALRALRVADPPRPYAPRLLRGRR
jgi:probable rRNA maturation factor